MRHEILISSGLGEEVLKSYESEKKIKKIAKMIENMVQENQAYEDIARNIVERLNKKENKNYD